jgi:hypothetical protein
MRVLLLMAAVVFVVGCKSNPYEDKPKVEPQILQVPTPGPTAQPTPGPTAAPTPTPKPTPTPTPVPVYSLEAPGVMKFRAGVNGSYVVRGIVPPPGTPQITFANLPAGMTYSSSQEKVSWTPANEDVGRTFVFEVRLKSSADVAQALTKEVVAVVESNVTPMVSLQSVKKQESESQTAVQLQFTAVSEQMPNWMVKGATPGEVQFITVKYAPKSFAGMLGNLLSMTWRVDLTQWTSNTKAIHIVACNPNGQDCTEQEIRLIYDSVKGLHLVHPDTSDLVEIGGKQ